MWRNKSPDINFNFITNAFENLNIQTNASYDEFDENGNRISFSEDCNSLLHFIFLFFFGSNFQISIVKIFLRDVEIASAIPLELDFNWSTIGILNVLTPSNK